MTDLGAADHQLRREPRPKAFDLQLVLDAEAWKSVTILDPNGRKIFDVNPKGALKTLGGSELFVESDEPALADVPLEDLFAQFPEGTYKFIGKSPDGENLESTATLSRKIPDGPSIVSPGTLDPAHAVIAWNPVTTPAGIDIVGYEDLAGPAEPTVRRPTIQAPRR